MTSGDVLVDRRVTFAAMLRERGDDEAALSLYEEIVEMAPAWAPGRFAMAETLEALGRYQDACAAFAAYLRLEDEDHMGASVRLALLGCASVPDHMPEAYVRTLFNQYAPRFDRALVEGLDYAAPFLLRKAVDRLGEAPMSGEAVLDLGCGTGLAGEAFRGRAAWLEGVDLSSGMIALARAKGIYDRLHEGEVSCVLGQLDRVFDLVVAADVLGYVGDLAPLFHAVRTVLRPGGLFAFSAQKGGGGTFTLGAECRFSHDPAYVRAMAATVGLDVSILEDAVCRREAGRDVPSLVGVLLRPRALAVEPHPDLRSLTEASLWKR